MKKIKNLNVRFLFGIDDAIMIPAIAGLVGAAGATAGNLISNRNTNKTNKELQDTANQQNVDLWHEQTLYNSPANMMERLKQAGLNPNLALGSLHASAASSAPQMLASKNNPAFQLDPLTAAQVANINADTALKKKEADETASRIKVNENSIEISGKQYELSASLTAAQVRQIDENIKLIQPQIDQITAASDKIRKEISIMDKDEQLRAIEVEVQEAMKDARVKQAFANLNLTNAQISKLVLEASFYPELVSAQIGALTSQASVNLSNSHFADVNAQYRLQEVLDYMSAEASRWRKSKYRSEASHNEADVWEGADSYALHAVTAIGIIMDAISPFSNFKFRGQ